MIMKELFDARARTSEGKITNREEWKLAKTRRLWALEWSRIQGKRPGRKHVLKANKKPIAIAGLG
jgi:hypothetical protein